MAVHRKKRSEGEKRAIVRALEKGRKREDVSSDFDISISTLDHLYARYKVNGTVATMPRSGRPRKTTEMLNRVIKRRSAANPFMHCVSICQELSEIQGVQVHPRTVGRRLDEMGLFARNPAKKPFINNRNRLKRLKFAREHLHWTSDDWAKVLWTDESKFCLYGSAGRKYVRRPSGKRNDPKYLKPTVKYGGGSVMVWGCFAREQVGPVVRIEGIMDAPLFVGIMEDTMLPYAKENMSRGWLYQQDNDPKHTSGLSKAFFKKNKIKVLEWPAQSPDLNPIENLWAIVDRDIAPKKHADKEALMKEIEEQWANISPAILANLVDSMPRRCTAVIECKGYCTKY
jgi:transposase